MSGAAVVAAGWGWRPAGRRAWAVHDLDLTIGAGERVLLLGPSGSGKSTVLAGLAGLLHTQDSGEAAGALTVDGVDAYAARHSTGLLLQDPDSQLVMTRCGDDVAFGPENHNVPRPEIWARVRAALDAVGFDYPLDRPTAALSGGEKQRLALAGLLANQPDLLLLDEPTANLDPDGAALVRAAVAAAAGVSGATLIVVEHRVAQWAPLVDRVVVLDPVVGVLADGPPDSVFTVHRSTLTESGVWVPGTPPPVPEPATGVGAPVLTARDVSFGYRHNADIVRDLGLEVRAGEVVAVVGPNGSGKTTAAMLLAGLARPRTGAVVATGSDRALHRRSSRSLAKAVGTVFQQPEHQFVSRSVREELRGPRADELMARLGLAHLADANPFTLSGGQQRRLAVATALVAAPPVLVLDEPTFGQDARTWRELLVLLRAVRAAGTALVVVSHDEAFVTALADRVLTMVDGRLTERIAA